MDKKGYLERFHLYQLRLSDATPLVNFMASIILYSLPDVIAISQDIKVMS